jgi:hypothetical protein
MEDILKCVQVPLKQLGFRKKGRMFWKIENEFYYLIDFQKGAYGDYFFVNVCVHPVGLPELIPNKLSIIEQPKEYECILRQRIEQIVPLDKFPNMKGGLFSSQDESVIERLIQVISNDVIQWLEEWGSYDKLANASEYDIYDKLTVIPILKRKAFLMLKSYCNFKIGKYTKANMLLEEFEKEKIEDMNFHHIKNYLKLLENHNTN